MQTISFWCRAVRFWILPDQTLTIPPVVKTSTSESAPLESTRYQRWLMSRKQLQRASLMEHLGPCSISLCSEEPSKSGDLRHCPSRIWYRSSVYRFCQVLCFGLFMDICSVFFASPNCHNRVFHLSQLLKLLILHSFTTQVTIGKMCVTGCKQLQH